MECPIHKTQMKKGKFTHYCVECAIKESNARKGRGKN